MACRNVSSWNSNSLQCVSLVVWCVQRMCLCGRTNALHVDPCSMDYDVFGLLSHKGYLKGEHMTCHVTFT